MFSKHSSPFSQGISFEVVIIETDITFCHSKKAHRRSWRAEKAWIDDQTNTTIDSPVWVACKSPLHRKRVQRSHRSRGCRDEPSHWLSSSADWAFKISEAKFSWTKFQISVSHEYLVGFRMAKLTNVKFSNVKSLQQMLTGVRQEMSNSRQRQTAESCEGYV